MGRIGAFFKKVGNGIKKGAKFVGQKLMPIARKVVDIAKTASPAIGMIPGVGGAINTGIGFADKGLRAAEAFKEGSSGGGARGVARGSMAAVNSLRN